MNARLDAEFIRRQQQRIEAAIVPVMEQTYGRDGTGIPGFFRPTLKPIERIVSFYDYYACGLSVVAKLAASGDARALRLVGRIQANMDHYRRKIYGRFRLPSGELWTVPLRRLVFHLARAYVTLEPVLSAADKRLYRALLEQQVAAAIEHNSHFHPGERNLHLGFVNNHTAIFMQGVYHSGLALGRPEWVRMAREFANRFYASGHPDGYWEENTNPAREGGPSIVYTPLTAGCLFDVLDGRRRRQEKFVKAGRFFRSFLTHDYRMIPLADERVNATGRAFAYGLALHSLTPRGRGYIVELLDSVDFTNESPETLAVCHYELGLMRTGACAEPESLLDGNSRISLPLGVVRRGEWTAVLSGMRALNRVRQPRSDYALDQQAVVYLAHRRLGPILTGIKSKNNTDFSTFLIGRDDGYPVDTGSLRMDSGWAEASLHYAKYDATARWDLGRRPRLTLSTGDSREVTTTLPVSDPRRIRSSTPFEVVKLKGFSPYTAGNKSDDILAVRFRWHKRLVVEFKA